MKAWGLLALFALTGCGSTPYWIKTHAPVAVTSITIVAVPCGRHDWDGCSNRGTGAIELRRGMPPVLHECVLRHELHELEGYSHEHVTTGHLATDCGDGEIVNQGVLQ